MNRLATLAITAIVIAGATPGIADSGRSLNSPQDGVLCDKYMCADANGVSKELTARFLGSSAAAKLFSQGAFDTTQFSFANGIFCDTKEKACHKDRYFDGNGKRSPINESSTSILFGKSYQ